MIERTTRIPGLGAVLIVVTALFMVACQPLGEGDDTESPSAAGTTAAEESVAADESEAPEEPAGESQQLTIATGGTGGVYFPLGGELALLLSENIDGVEATAQETSASVDNMLLIGTGDADIAFVLGDTAADAVEGRGADFEGNAVDACTLGILYGNYTHLVTTDGAGIESVEDLRGKRVSLGAPGSGTEIIALRILEAAGIDPDADITRSQLLADETAAALSDGTIDAGFWSGGLPTGAFVEFATGGNMHLVPTAEYTQDLADEYGPFYLERTIPADTYDGVEEDVDTIVVPNVLVVNNSMDEELQQQITAVLFEQKDALVEAHAAAEELDVATAGEVEFMDVCPGAQSYYDENS